MWVRPLIGTVERAQGKVKIGQMIVQNKKTAPKGGVYLVAGVGFTQTHTIGSKTNILLQNC
jgi:hypothetical protein